MQGQDLKHIKGKMFSPKSLWLFLAILMLTSFVPAQGHANMPTPTKRPNIALKHFYDEWVLTQRGTIPQLKEWTDTYFNDDSKIRFDITAKIPALLDHEFHKTIKVDAKDAEKHLIQWLNVHKHNKLDYKIISTHSDADGIYSEVSYSASGVTVLPQGRHKTIRMGTDLDITCHDQLTPPPIKVIKSFCTMQAESVPLKQRGD